MTRDEKLMLCVLEEAGDGETKLLTKAGVIERFARRFPEEPATDVGEVGIALVTAYRKGWIEIDGFIRARDRLSG